MNPYHVKEISKTEYQVYYQELEAEEPRVYAMCTGPVPAYEIKTALNVVRQLESNKFTLLNMATSLKTFAERFRVEVDDLKNYDKIKSKY